MVVTLAVLVSLIALMVVARVVIDLLRELGVFDDAAVSAWDRLARWGIVPGSEPVVVWRRAWRLWMVIFGTLAIGLLAATGAPGAVNALFLGGLGLAAGTLGYSSAAARWHAARQYPNRRGRCMWCGAFLPRDERNSCMPCKGCGWTPPGLHTNRAREPRRSA